MNKLKRRYDFLKKLSLFYKYLFQSLKSIWNDYFVSIIIDCIHFLNYWNRFVELCRFEFNVSKIFTTYKRILLDIFTSIILRNKYKYKEINVLIYYIAIEVFWEIWKRVFLLHSIEVLSSICVAILDLVAFFAIFFYKFFFYLSKINIGYPFQFLVPH